MTSAFAGMLTMAAIPAVVVAVGGMAAAKWTPGPRLRSAVQHLAAGVVFAAASSEVLPGVVKTHDATSVAVGFVLGAAMMLGIKAVVSAQGGDEALAARPSSLFFVTALDVLVDGLLIGLAYSEGAREGALLTLALTIEVLFLGLSVASDMAASGAKRRAIVAATSALGLAILLGACAGALVSGLVPLPVHTGLLALGLAALLYLVTEELLVEAHEVPEEPWMTALFFAGYLFLLMVGIVTA